jgi:hypothetical protein
MRSEEDGDEHEPSTCQKKNLIGYDNVQQQDVRRVSRMAGKLRSEVARVHLPAMGLNRLSGSLRSLDCATGLRHSALRIK